MSERLQVEELYEFGPFRVDAVREILQKDGLPVELTPKTFQILLVLARRGNDVVSKEDLLQAVWPDTYIDEANLSRNIFLLRKALGETAKGQRYIVTVSGRGYRLAEPVGTVSDQRVPEYTVAATSRSRLEIEIEESAQKIGWRWIAASVTALAMALVVWFYRSDRHKRPALSAQDTVVLARIANSTGDPVLGETLRQGLAIQLRQSPWLSLVSDQRMGHVLRLMGRKADTPLTSEMTQDLCRRTGSAAVLEGSIAPLGSQYVLTLEARRCLTGEVIDQQQTQLAKKEDALHALDRIATRFRERVGESLATIKEHNTPLAEATTSSLEALEAYSTGWRLQTVSGPAAALSFMQRAVALDPGFALAQASLARLYYDLEASDLATASATRAWQARERASDREKFFITAVYEGLATGNQAAARQNDEAWARSYPRDASAHAMLSGFPSKAFGNYRQAISEATEAISIDPDFAIMYYNLAVNHVYLGEIGLGQEALNQARSRGLQIDEFLMLQYDIDFLNGDRTAMARTAALARERSGADTWISNKEAYAAAYCGQLQKARLQFARAIEQAVQEKQTERAALWQAGDGLREAFFGQARKAQADAFAALDRARNREVAFGAALTLAMTGSTSRAQASADDMEQRFPEDTVVLDNYVPVIRARVALNQGNPAKAIQLLERARPIESGASRLLFGALYPSYLRGEAYLAAHQPRQAALEFQSVLDHRGVVVCDPIGALARLQLGRALVMDGDRPAGLRAYQDFLLLWRDADRDAPVLKKAKAEYAVLKAQ